MKTLTDDLSSTATLWGPYSLIFRFSMRRLGIREDSNPPNATQLGVGEARRQTQFHLPPKCACFTGALFCSFSPSPDHIAGCRRGLVGETKRSQLGTLSCPSFFLAKAIFLVPFTKLWEAPRPGKAELIFPL